MDSTMIVYGAIALMGLYLFKSGKLDALIAKVSGGKSDDLPLPKQPDQLSGRPVLDWMAAVVLKGKGTDPEVYQAVKAEVAAIKGLK